MDEQISVFSQKLLKDWYTLSDFIAEFRKPCGRFKTPFSAFELLQLKFAEWVATLQIFTTFDVIPHYTIPPNWQTLLNYLHREGILKKPFFSMWPRRNDLPQYYHAHLGSRLNTDNPGRIGRTVNPEGYGLSHRSLEEAYAKATGELLERYFMTLYDDNEATAASYATLARQKKNVLNLHELPTFLPWQKEIFKEFQFDNNTVFRWLQTRNLISDESAYVPAQMLYWGYDLYKYKEPFLRQMTTNGEAGGYTFIESVLSAIYESVERDGFLIYWLNTISPPLIDVETFDDAEVQDFLSLLKQYGLRVYFLDTTTDIGIPSCICIIIDERTGEPIISMGGSAGFNPAKNILSSAREALNGQNSREVQDIQTISEKDYKPFTERAINQPVRIGIWQGRAMYKHFVFLLSGTKTPFEQSQFGKTTIVFDSAEEEYQHVRTLFAQKGEGYELYCYEAHHPILTKLGYHVVKVLIPELMPLYLTEHLATLDTKRLREVPAKLGYTETTLNPWPHPFP